ncbi:MAG: hypothetical protein MPJ24_01590, partial [Pirellulaceae bacterium]|nr:hypothetical protein [Pirellulaceae bacterium]
PGFGQSPGIRLGTGLVGVVMEFGFTGCQVNQGGQILPSPYYLTDDIQYSAPGPSFILENEANMLKSLEADN